MMISDGETKGSDSHGGGSHAFPLLKNTASVDPTGTSNDCFKPLFKPTSTDGNLSAIRGIGVPGPGGEQDSEDTARREGFDRGFDAGKQDACSLVKEEMAPQIKSFADAFSLWNATMMRVEEKSNLQILKMAVAIAEKILGAPPRCCNDKLESLKADLSARRRNAYQLQLKLNPQDMDALAGMIACENAQWAQWDYIAATSDADVQRGALVADPGSQALSADDGILRSLDASLSERLA